MNSYIWIFRGMQKADIFLYLFLQILGWGGGSINAEDAQRVRVSARGVPRSKT